ncbi:MAG: von Willebrand factor type A domain-containing protein, partial [Opitutus sp.]
YALGELEGADRAAVEVLLRENAATRQAVASIRAVTVEVTAALRDETRSARPVLTKADSYSTASRSKVLRMPWLPYLGSGLVAACLVVVLALQEAPRRTVPQVRYSQIPLGEPVLGVDDESVLMALPEVVVSSPRLETFRMNPIDRATPRFDVSASGLLDESKKLLELPHGELNPWDPAPPLIFSFNYGDTKSRAVDAERAHRRRQLARTDGANTRSPEVSRADRYRNSSKAPAFVGDTPLFTVNDDPIVLNRLIVEGAVPPGRMARNATAGGGTARWASNAYAYRRESEFVSARASPLSTFGAEIETASYANVRSLVVAGQRPPIEAVRIEEMLNSFPYDYARPRGSTPFAATLEVAESPWSPRHQLVRIAVKGKESLPTARAPANLVFLIDVSASMDRPNKLPLIKETMRLLLGRLRAQDRVAIVTYAGSTGVVLPSTPADQKAKISGALNDLKAQTASQENAGLSLAYEIAKSNFVSGGTNRVVLCTDGDFNVGPPSEGSLVRMVREHAQGGVFLSVLGFGMSNIKDSLLQQIADRGSGSYGYIESKREAEKMMFEQVSESLVTIAKDVRLQVEFNPTKVASYRLIGYEKRTPKAGELANEKVTGAEMTAGRTLTALYEIVPVDVVDPADGPKLAEQELRYVSTTNAPPGSRRARPEITNELLTLKIRYREPGGLFTKKLEFSLLDNRARFASASSDFKFAAAVAGFGMVLRDSPFKGSTTLGDVVAWAGGATGSDPGGYRTEFISVVERAKSLL